MDADAVLHVVAFAGKLLLESGAETYRVEETMVRIARSFPIDDAQSFVTPTGVMMSITMNGKTSSYIQRVQKRGVDLHKIDRINALSRQLNLTQMSIEDLKEELQHIQQEERYSFFVTIFFSALGAGAFGIFFNGTLNEAIAAFLIGIVVKAVSIWLEKIHTNSFFSNSIAAGITAFLALIYHTLVPSSDLDIIIISSIMLLVPGLAITNAIRDTVAGDFLSGVSRATEAFLIAIAIAVGTGAVMSLWMSIGGILL